MTDEFPMGFAAVGRMQYFFQAYETGDLLNLVVISPPRVTRGPFDNCHDFDFQMIEFLADLPCTTGLVHSVLF